jgi:hypothetical protein
MIWRSEASYSCPYQDSNFDPSVVEPVASHYTDWDIAALYGCETSRPLIFWMEESLSALTADPFYPKEYSW